MKTKNNYTKAIIDEHFKERYYTKSVLGGLISWNVILKTDRIGCDIAIRTEENFERVFVNGEEYIKNGKIIIDK